MPAFFFYKTPLFLVIYAGKFSVFLIKPFWIGWDPPFWPKVKKNTFFYASPNSKKCVCIGRGAQTESKGRTMSWHIRQKPNRNRRGMRTNSGLLRLWKIHFHPSFKIFYNLVVHPFEKPKANTDRCFLPTKPIFGPPTHNTCKEWEVWDFRTWSRQTEWFSSHTRYSELEHIKSFLL